MNIIKPDHRLKKIVIEKLFNKLIAGLHWIEDISLYLLLAIMLSLGIGQILLRNFFDSGIFWAEPAMRIMVLWVALIGAMIASRDGGHIVIKILTLKLSGLRKQFIAMASCFFGAVICFTSAYFSLLFVLVEKSDGALAFANVPIWFCEVIIPIAFLVMGLRFMTAHVVVLTPQWMRL